MATFTGTGASDTIREGFISGGVLANPEDATPGSDADILFGGGGNDTLEGSGGDDSVYGGIGNDSLLGGADADDIYGEDGDDILDGGAGADTMTGGAGADRYRVDDAGDTLVEIAGGGIDTVVASTDWTLGVEFENLRLVDDVVGYGNGLNNVMDGGYSYGTLYGLGGDDTMIGVYGSFGSSTLVGGTGDDHYELTLSNYGETIISEMPGGGTDTVEVNIAKWWASYYEEYVLEENFENVIIEDWFEDIRTDENGHPYYYDAWYSEVTCNALANVVQGGVGYNTLLGMAGDDTIYGNENDDTLDGGAGTDRLDGGDGSDTVLYTTNTTPVTVDLVAGRVSFPGTNYKAEVIIDIENAETGSGNDTFIGNDEANSFLGRAGNDTFDGRGGTDYFDGGSGVDTILYTANTTSVELDLGQEWARFPGKSWPEETFDRVENASTGSGDDTLTGGGAANVLDGGGGDDLVRGSNGDDTVQGGDGNDTLDGGDGDDRITGGASAADIRDVVYAGTGDDAVDAGYGNDLVYGQDGDDTLSGGFGADELQGQDDDDILAGSALSDLLFGGDGRDFLNGGFGFDRVNGGAGADDFYHLGIAGHGSDFIQDYDAEEGDVLVFGGSTARASDFRVNFANTPGAGSAAIDEAFVIYKPTGQILWALIDGEAQDEINLVIGDPSGGIHDILG